MKACFWQHIISLSPCDPGVITSVAGVSVPQHSRSFGGMFIDVAANSTVLCTASEAFFLHDANPHCEADIIWDVQEVRGSPGNARIEDKADVT